MSAAVPFTICCMVCQKKGFNIHPSRVVIIQIRLWFWRISSEVLSKITIFFNTFHMKKYFKTSPHLFHQIVHWPQDQTGVGTAHRWRGSRTKLHRCKKLGLIFFSSSMFRHLKKMFTLSSSALWRCQVCLKKQRAYFSSQETDRGAGFPWPIFVLDGCCADIQPSRDGSHWAPPGKKAQLRWSGGHWKKVE